MPTNITANFDVKTYLPEITASASDTQNNEENLVFFNPKNTEICQNILFTQ